VRRLKLILADKDEPYIESLTGYLMEKHPYKFQVNSFTNKDHFKRFLAEDEGIIDIVLVGEEFCDNLNGLEQDNKLPVIIRISERMTVSEYFSKEIAGCKNEIYKYCSGEKLVKDISNIYEKEKYSNMLLEKEVKKTRMVSVYSPAGGTGKTTIAANLSIQYAREGMKVFYLNLESIRSVNCFPGSLPEKEAQNSFSKILFSLKEKDTDINHKIEAARCKALQYDIYYFPPPDNAMELDEISACDIKYLVDQIKLMAQYDIIIADLASSFNQLNTAVMEDCDEIVLVTTTDMVALSKMEHFVNSLQIYCRKKNISFIDKATIIINKWEEGSSFDINRLNSLLSTPGKNIDIKLPFEERLELQEWKADEINSFNRELRKLIGRFDGV